MTNDEILAKIIELRPIIQKYHSLNIEIENANKAINDLQTESRRLYTEYDDAKRLIVRMIEAAAKE